MQSAASTTMHGTGNALSPITTDSPEDTPANGPSVNCRVPVSQVGDLTFSSAMALIHRGRMEIRENYMTDNVDPALIGTVLKFDETGIASDGIRKLSGLVLFYGGSMLSQLSSSTANNDDALDRSHMDDLVFRKQGSLSGHVAACTATTVTIVSREGVHHVPVDSITYMRSPHAFVFTLSGVLSADKSHTRPHSISFQSTVNSDKIGDSLVVGHRPDSLDALLDDDADTKPAITPIIMPRFRQSGGVFSNWP